MNNLLGFLNEVSVLWGERMVRASLTSGGLIVLLWVLCRCWPGMSSSGRSWLWRAAFGKLLLALCWSASTGLPIVPTFSPHIPSPPNPKVATLTSPSLSSFPTLAPTFLPSPSKKTIGKSSSPNVSSFSSPSTTNITKAPHPAVSTRKTLTGWSVALGCWLFGVGFLMYRGLGAWRTTRRWCEDGELVLNPTLNDSANALCKRFDLGRSPQLLSCPWVDTLALTGVRRPAILLSPRFLENGSEAPLQLMIAHELAHHKRHDLVWNWLLWLGQTLFWFHPLVWLGAREWRMAQEVACDELAIQVTQVPVAAYGAMLLQTAIKGRSFVTDNVFAVGVGERYATLHQRLSAMKHFSSKTQKRALLFCGALAALAVLPWHLAFRSASAQAPSKHGTVAKRDQLTSQGFKQSPTPSNAQFSDPTTPQGTLRTFAAALTHADLSKATTLIQGAKTTRDLSDIKRAMRKVPTNYSINHLRISLNGDTATISFFFAVDPLPTKSTYEAWAVLRRGADGTWAINPERTRELSHNTQPFPAFVSLLSGQQLPDENEVTVVGDKFLTLGSVMHSFVADKAGKFALENESFRNDLLPYYPTLDGLLPSTRQDHVSFNTKLSNVPINKVRFPRRTVMLYEGQNGKLDFRHQGRAVVTFVSGAVRYVNPKWAKESLIWAP